MKKGLIFFIFNILFLGMISLCTCSGQSAEETSPTVIDAERLEIDLNQNMASFIGKVKAVHEQGVLECQELQVIFEKSTGQINKLVAKGKVKISQDNNTGLCEEAIYEFIPKRKITLTGNPQLTRGKEKFSGESIIFLVDEQRIIIKDKVKGVVFPQKSKEGDLPLLF